MKITNTNLELIEVWATVAEGREYSYEDIYDDKKEAEKQMGFFTSDGDKIVDVFRGWFIKGTDDLDEISEDIYYERGEALGDLEERILPSYEDKYGKL